MIFSPAQFILLAIILFFAYNSVKKYIRKEAKLKDLVIHLFFWLVAGIVILFPGLSQRAAEAVGIGRGVDLIIYITLLVIFYLVLYLMNRQKETDERLTKLARKMTLMDSGDSQNVELENKK